MSAKHIAGPPVSEQDLATIIAQRLIANADEREQKLDDLAERANVEPKLLHAIANGQRAPSIAVLWKIANALDVPFGALIARPRPDEVLVIRRGDDNLLESSNGAFRSRALTAFGANPRVEIYELVIAAGHIEKSQAHTPGVSENIVVAKGALEIIVGREPPYRLEQGDAIHFHADVPHSYRNIGEDEAVAHLVLSYEDFRGN
jgi:XRE family transcriptional regulator, regulator of sulfur utilization